MTEPESSPILGLKDIADQVAAMRREVAVYKQGLQAEYERLNHEAEMQKKLSRYARRTWFEMMAWIFLAGLLISDVARAYADNEWWGLLFWATQHGDGGPDEWAIRGVGLAWQAILLITLGRRSQVPDWIYDRIPYAEEQRLHKRKGSR